MLSMELVIFLMVLDSSLGAVNELVALEGSATDAQDLDPKGVLAYEQRDFSASLMRWSCFAGVNTNVELNLTSGV